MNDFRTVLWPAACAAAFAGSAALESVLEYRRLIGKHAWTAATIWIPLGLIFVFFWGALGAVLGRAVRAAATEEDGRRRLHSVLIVAAVGLFAAFACFKRATGRRRALRIDAIEAAVPTLEGARAIAAQGRDERLALAQNRACPPEILAEFARSPDRELRSMAAWNRSTPPDVLAALARDEN